MLGNYLIVKLTGEQSGSSSRNHRCVCEGGEVADGKTGRRVCLCVCVCSCV